MPSVVDWNAVMRRIPALTKQAISSQPVYTRIPVTSSKRAVFVFNWIVWQKLQYALRDGNINGINLMASCITEYTKRCSVPSVLCNDLPVLLEDVAVHQPVCFVYDRVPLYFRSTLRKHLNPTFSTEWIRRGGPINWSARSSELNSPDFVLWRHVKTLVYSEPIADLEVTHLVRRLE